MTASTPWIRLADLFDDEMGDEEGADCVRAGITAVDHRHLVPPDTQPRPTVRLASFPKPTTWGRHALRQYKAPPRTVVSAEILIRRGEHPHPEHTAVHECGHFVDYVLLRQDGDAGSFAGANSSGPLADWWRAVEVTDARIALLNRLESANAQQTEHLQYLLLPVELFARSYAQWVTEVSPEGHPLRATLEARLERQRAGGYHSQWEASDFEAVSAALSAAVAQGLKL